MTSGDVNYPVKLREIYDSPKLLYYKGDVDLDKYKKVAIVGAREASSYGMKIAYEFAYKLARAGILVVSGMARGIDSAAHLGALRAGGKTVAILGNGLDMAYPKSNKELMKKIENQGMVISEYPAGTLPLKFHFPERNRIISGMSDFVLVIEAKQRSGSLITARLALESGRDVGCIPANINSEFSIGSNLLIKEGAYPILSVEDILELL